MSGQLYMPEILGPGVALLDFDNDGDLDVFLVQGQMLGRGKTIADALFPPRGSEPPRGRLFRNDLQVSADGTRRIHFTDVTEQSGINARGTARQDPETPGIQPGNASRARRPAACSLRAKN